MLMVNCRARRFLSILAAAFVSAGCGSSTTSAPQDRGAPPSLKATPDDMSNGTQPGTKTHRLQVVFKPAITPRDRSKLYERPIDEELEKARIGKWTGGGTFVDGSASDCSFEVSDLEKGIEIIRSVLRNNNAPKTTKIQLLGAEKKTFEVYD
jgi:hypothetical protein